MSRKTNFIRQGTILAMASIIVRLIGIVYRVPLANIIGDDANGIYLSSYEGGPLKGGDSNYNFIYNNTIK